jgi:hypothetical protein
MVIVIMTSLIFIILLFFQIFGVVQDHSQEYLIVFWLQTIYGGIKLLKSLYILAKNPRNHCKVLV